MQRFISLMMYVLWTATIIAVLTTTFTDFQYEDLNMIALLLLAFTLLNTFFAMTMDRE